MPSKKTKGSRKTARKAVQSAAKVSNRTDAQNDEESKAAEEDSFLEEAIKLAAKEKKALKKAGKMTAEQQAFLTRLGCHSLQGYLLGRPMTAESLSAAMA